MIIYYFLDIGRGFGDRVVNRIRRIFKKFRIQGEKKKIDIEQIIRGLVNVEEKNRDLCNCVIEQ